jgi:hypothetical protein
MALRSIGGGLPVGFSTLYEGSSAAPAQAIAMLHRASLPTPWGTLRENLVAVMPILLLLKYTTPQPFQLQLFGSEKAVSESGPGTRRQNDEVDAFLRLVFLPAAKPNGMPRRHR